MIKYTRKIHIENYKNFSTSSPKIYCNFQCLSHFKIFSETKADGLARHILSTSSKFSLNGWPKQDKIKSKVQKSAENAVIKTIQF